MKNEPAPNILSTREILDNSSFGKVSFNNAAVVTTSATSEGVSSPVKTQRTEDGSELI